MPKGRCTKSCRHCGATYDGPTASLYCGSRCLIRASSIVDENGCWIWQKSLTPDGYGRTTTGDRRKRMGAHRLAYVAFRGPIVNREQFVCHSCDVRACCNPDHMFLGTAADNLQDASAKGRLRHGEEINTAKLREDQVRAIRADARQQKEIASEYGLSRNQIANIKQRKSWRHVL